MDGNKRANRRWQEALEDLRGRLDCWCERKSWHRGFLGCVAREVDRRRQEEEEAA